MTLPPVARHAGVDHAVGDDAAADVGEGHDQVGYHLARGESDIE